MSAGLLQVKAPLRAATARGSYNLSRQAVLTFLCVLWFIPGVIGRTPWKPAETILVPVVAESMANGEVLVPRLFDEPYLSMPPLYNAMASTAAYLLSPPLAAHEAMRFGNLLWLVLGFALVGCVLGWAYGSRIGWRAVLLVAGSPALVLHARTLNPDITLLALGAAGLVGIHWLRTRPLRGSVLLGIVAAVGLWASGIIALWYVTLLVALPLLRRSWKFRWRNQIGAGAALLISFIGLSLWLLVLHAVAPSLPGELLDVSLTALQPQELIVNAQLLISDGVWVLWPALPFAALTVVSLRTTKHKPDEVRLGLRATWAGAIAIICTGELTETRLFLLLPATALIATVGVSRLTREIAKAMDWFAIIVIGGGLIGFFWLTWLLAISGLSSDFLAWLAVRGVNRPEFNWAVPAAFLATVAWVVLMLRIGRSPERSVLNWMTGATMAWWVFTLLWLPEVDRVKGYQEVAWQLREQVPQEQCVQAVGVRMLVVAQLEYFTALNLADDTSACNWQLLPATATRDGEVLWSGGRAGDRGNERLQLVRVD